MQACDAIGSITHTAQIPGPGPRMLIQKGNEPTKELLLRNQCNMNSVTMVPPRLPAAYTHWKTCLGVWTHASAPAGASASGGTLVMVKV